MGCRYRTVSAAVVTRGRLPPPFQRVRLHDGTFHDNIRLGDSGQPRTSHAPLFASRLPSQPSPHHLHYTRNPDPTPCHTHTRNDGFISGNHDRPAAAGDPGKQQAYHHCLFAPLLLLRRMLWKLIIPCGYHAVYKSAHEILDSMGVLADRIATKVRLARCDVNKLAGVQAQYQITAYLPLPLLPPPIN
jgi:hypothetical protein